MHTSTRERVLSQLLDDLGQKLPAGTTLVGIDGFDGAGKTHLAHELTARARIQGRRPVLNVSMDDFHHPRSRRYAHGRTAESFFRDSYDYDAFRRAVVEPLRHGCPITSGVWDVDRDVPLPETTFHVPTDGIVLVDGMFLHRPELRDVWDASIWVRVPFEVSVPRGNARFPGPHDPNPEGATNQRYVGGQRLYLAEGEPEAHCTWIVDNTDLGAPRIIGSGRA